jgi:hypothetical protein
MRFSIDRTDSRYSSSFVRSLTLAGVVDQFRGEMVAERVIKAMSWLINVGLVYAREPVRTVSAELADLESNLKESL